MYSPGADFPKLLVRTFNTPLGNTNTYGSLSNVSVITVCNLILKMTLLMVLFCYSQQK